jgi:hypothetical protein
MITKETLIFMKSSRPIPVKLFLKSSRAIAVKQYLKSSRALSVKLYSKCRRHICQDICGLEHKSSQLAVSQSELAPIVLEAQNGTYGSGRSRFLKPYKCDC